MGKWSKEATILLIEEVKKVPFLYDPRNKRYHDRRARRAAMNDIATLVSKIRPETTGEEVRVRWGALRSAFQGSMTKIKRQINGTLGSDITKVWYFDDMLFLCNVQPSRNDVYYTNEAADVVDNSTQDEDVHHYVTGVEDTMDETALENHISKAFSVESCPMKNVTRNDPQKENLQRKTLQGKNLQMEQVQIEDLQMENIQIENVQGEIQQRENIQEEIQQRENQQRGSSQGEGPLFYKGSAEDLGGSRRKRSYEVAFYQTLDIAVKKLMDKANDDEDFIFGKLVAYELKSLQSPILKKKLKHKILQNILETQNGQD